MAASWKTPASRVCITKETSWHAEADSLHGCEQGSPEPIRAQKKKGGAFYFFFQQSLFFFQIMDQVKRMLDYLNLVGCGVVLAGVLQVERLQPSAQSARSLCYLCSEFWTLTVFEEEKKRQGQWLFVSLKGSTVSSGWHGPRTTCCPSCGIVLLPWRMDCPVPAFL